MLKYFIISLRIFFSCVYHCASKVEDAIGKSTSFELGKCYEDSARGTPAVENLDEGEFDCVSFLYDCLSRTLDLVIYTTTFRCFLLNQHISSIVNIGSYWSMFLKYIYFSRHSPKQFILSDVSSTDAIIIPLHQKL